MIFMVKREGVLELLSRSLKEEGEEGDGGKTENEGDTVAQPFVVDLKGIEQGSEQIGEDGAVFSLSQ